MNTEAADGHYRYAYTHAPERRPRPRWTVRAVVNAGHQGSVLNCPHPACVRVRHATAAIPPVPEGDGPP